MCRYTELWHRAVNAGAHAISITSYNEWGEGTQIEAARPYFDDSSNHTYKDYGGKDASLLYIQLTHQHAQEFKLRLAASSQQQDTASSTPSGVDNPGVDLAVTPTDEQVTTGEHAEL